MYIFRVSRSLLVRHLRSSCLRTFLYAIISLLYHGADGLMTTIFRFLGAYLSRRSLRTVLNWVTMKLTSLVAQSKSSVEFKISCVKAVESMDRILRHVRTSLRQAVFFMNREQFTAKWSDRPRSCTETSDNVFSDARVIIASRVWPFRCVDSLTCCSRLNESSRTLNLLAKESLMSSRWKLKSPTINSRPESITDCSRRTEKSSKRWTVDDTQQ